MCPHMTNLDHLALNIHTTPPENNPTERTFTAVIFRCNKRLQAGVFTCILPVV